MEFEWDASKELENIRKHRVTFSEATTAFFDPKGFVLEDTKHSDKEYRFFHVGLSRSGRVLTTRYTRRGLKIRIFGSNEWRKMRKMYYDRTQS